MSSNGYFEPTLVIQLHTVQPSKEPSPVFTLYHKKLSFKIGPSIISNTFPFAILPKDIPPGLFLNASGLLLSTTTKSPSRYLGMSPI